MILARKVTANPLVPPIPLDQVPRLVVAISTTGLLLRLALVLAVLAPMAPKSPIVFAPLIGAYPVLPVPRPVQAMALALTTPTLPS